MPRLASLLSGYGILPALLLLCLYFSWATFTEQRPTGAPGGAQLAGELARTLPRGAAVLIVARDSREDSQFAEALRGGLEGAGLSAAGEVRGQPADAREALERIARSGQ